MGTRGLVLGFHKGALAFLYRYCGLLLNWSGGKRERRSARLLLISPSAIGPHQSETGQIFTSSTSTSQSLIWFSSKTFLSGRRATSGVLNESESHWVAGNTALCYKSPPSSQLPATYLPEAEQLRLCLLSKSGLKYYKTKVKVPPSLFSLPL